MNFKALFLLVLLSLFLAGCVQQQANVSCNAPYYEYMTGQCCLDSNSDKICDSDQSAAQASEQAAPTGGQNAPAAQPTQQPGATASESPATPAPTAEQATASPAPTSGPNVSAEATSEPSINVSVESTPTPSAEAAIPVPACGDGECSSSETGCCTDCGCFGGQFCYNNSCTTVQVFKPSTLGLRLTSLCGNNACEIGENSTTCCLDCNCSFGFFCSNNICASSKFKPIPMATIVPLAISPEKVIDSAGMHPRIYENLVVFQKYVNSQAHIFVHNVLNNQTTQISNATAEYSPAIFSNQLVWEDLRRPTGGENYDIYYYNTQNYGEGIITTQRTGYKFCPSIYGNTIAWKEQIDSKHYIFFYNLATGVEKKISDSSHWPDCPSVWGDYIAWTQLGSGYPQVYDLVLYQISTGTSKAVVTSNAYFDTAGPSLKMGRIAFIQGLNTASQVFVYDIASKLTTQLTTTPSVKSQASIYGDRAVWADRRGAKAQIFMYEIGAKRETQLTNSTYHQESPDIYGDRIVYKDATGHKVKLYTIS